MLRNSVAVEGWQSVRATAFERANIHKLCVPHVLVGLIHS